MQAIERVFAILRALAGGDASVGDVSATTGLPKSTVSRLLAALEAEGAVDRIGDDGRYAIGPGLAVLTGHFSMVGAVRELARPYLRDLMEETGEAAGMGVPDGPRNVLYTDFVDTQRPIGTRDWSGTRFPYHTVAAGYALLATWTDAEIVEYAAAGLDTYTGATADTLVKLRRRISQVRRNGYAWTFQDFSEEINGVGAAVVFGGRAVAAISVYGPAYRFPGDDDADRIGRRVAVMAENLSRALNP